VRGLRKRLYGENAETVENAAGVKIVVYTVGAGLLLKPLGGRSMLAKCIRERDMEEHNERWK
jgi:hypothetical protein